MPDISAIITAHQEGVMAGLTLHSLMEAKEHAEQTGLSVEALVFLDNPDDATRRVFTNAHEDLIVREVSYKDQGKVRNHAVAAATGEYIAFLDADDLWGYNWLTAAHTSAGRGRIVHPEFNYFFGDSNNIFVKMDQRDPNFDVEFLRVGNYWDALCFTTKEVHEALPYYDRDIAAGYAYEDWHWNCATIEQGFEHTVAPDTIHFKRRRDGSQSAHSLERKAIVRPTDMFRYDWHERATG